MEFIHTSQIYKCIKTNSFSVRINCKDGKILYGYIRFFFIKKDNPSSLFFIFNSLTVEHIKMFHHLEKKVQIDHILPVIEEDEYLVISL